MKKFTIISLMLVLVASFVFAAGLTPYVDSSNKVTFSGYDNNGTGAGGVATKPFLTSIIFDGSIVAGVKNAAETVDVNAEVDLTYYDVEENFTGHEKYARSEINSEDKTYSAANYTGNSGYDQLTFVPSLNAEYYDNNLRVDLNFELQNVRWKKGIFGMDGQNFDEGEGCFYDAFTSSISGAYAQKLKSSDNLVKADAAQSLYFDGDNVESTTTAGLSFYVPKAGTTTKTVMADKFDSVTKAYVFRGYANASVGFSATNGKLDADSHENGATFGLDYFKFITGGFANLNGKFVAKHNAIATSYTSSVNGEYKYSDVRGENKKDVFAVDVKAGVSNSSVKDAPAQKSTVVTASAKVSIPRLIPVELIDSMSFNLPMDFYATYKQVFAAENKETTTLSFDVTAYPVYVEFAEGAYSIFGKALKTLTVSAMYGNQVVFEGNIKDNTSKYNNYKYGFGTKLALDGGAFDFAYNYKEMPAGVKDISLVTLSYSVNYSD